MSTLARASAGLARGHPAASSSSFVPLRSASFRFASFRFVPESQKVERKGRVIGEALLNPTVIVEVLSDSTEEYDRGEKFGHYMRLQSLKEYVLVSTDPPKIEVFRRPARGHWEREQAHAGETIRIHEATIHVDEVYRRATT